MIYPSIYEGLIQCSVAQPSWYHWPLIGAQVFQIPRNHFKILFVSMITWNKFHLEDLQILVANVQNLVATVQNLVATVQNVVAAVQNLVATVQILFTTVQNLVATVKNVVARVLCTTALWNVTNSADLLFKTIWTLGLVRARVGVEFFKCRVYSPTNALLLI